MKDSKQRVTFRVYTILINVKSGFFLPTEYLKALLIKLDNECVSNLGSKATLYGSPFITKFRWLPSVLTLLNSLANFSQNSTNAISSGSYWTFPADIFPALDSAQASRAAADGWPVATAGSTPDAEIALAEVQVSYSAQEWPEVAVVVLDQRRKFSPR